MPAVPLQLLVAGPVRTSPGHRYGLWQPHDAGVPPAAAGLLYAAAWRPLLLLGLLLPLPLQHPCQGRRSMAHGEASYSAFVSGLDQKREMRSTGDTTLDDHESRRAERLTQCCTEVYRTTFEGVHWHESVSTAVQLSAVDGRDSNKRSWFLRFTRRWSDLSEDFLEPSGKRLCCHWLEHRRNLPRCYILPVGTEVRKAARFVCTTVVSFRRWPGNQHPAGQGCPSVLGVTGLARTVPAAPKCCVFSSSSIKHGWRPASVGVKNARLSDALQQCRTSTGCQQHP